MKNTMLCKDPSLVLIKKDSSEYLLLKRQLLRTRQKCKNSTFKTICRGSISREYMEESIQESEFALVYYSKKKCKNENIICGLLMFSYHEKQLYIKLLCTRRSNGDAKGKKLLKEVENFARDIGIYTIATRATINAYVFWKKMGFLRLSDACVWTDTHKAKKLIYPSCGKKPYQYIDSKGCQTTEASGKYCKTQNPDADVLCQGGSQKNELKEDEDPLLYGFWISKCIQNSSI